MRFDVGSVQPQNLLIRDWNVENQTTNAPPANGPAGEQYVIGPLPTGAWAGNAKKIAFRPALNGAFVILAAVYWRGGLRQVAEYPLPLYRPDLGIDSRRHRRIWIRL
jgi:hypothetical protein